MPARICYVEIPAPDLEKAGAFYRGVFGWNVESSQLEPAAPYWMFTCGEGQLTGGLDPKLPVNHGGPILYLAVDDIRKTLDAIARAGGSVVRDKLDIGGGYGFTALFTDPNGNRLGLFART